MNNHPLINPETGETEWVARNMATLVIIFAINKDNQIHVLANKRGPNTPDPEFRGCWCMPCGYLDYNETLKEAAARETFEETGLTIDPKKLRLVYINDKPEDDKRQNVTFRYQYIVQEFIEDINLTSKNSEEKEVSDIKWIPIKEIDNYKWAFNHDKIIKDQI
jgi:8-oxo-dGTP pyrophosphatase MutT (NUDIX family)